MSLLKRIIRIVKGESVIFAPTGKYDLKVFYNGFNLFEKMIRLGIIA